MSHLKPARMTSGAGPTPVVIRLPWLPSDCLCSESVCRKVKPELLVVLGLVVVIFRTGSLTFAASPSSVEENISPGSSQMSGECFHCMSALQDAAVGASTAVPLVFSKGRWGSDITIVSEHVTLLAMLEPKQCTSHTVMDGKSHRKDKRPHSLCEIWLVVHDDEALQLLSGLLACPLL